MDTKIKLSPITTSLHWIIGISMIVLIVMGLYMEEFDAEYLFDIHISLGVIVGLIVVPRVLWRIKNGWPTHVSDYNRFEQISGKVVHWVLIIATVLMPLSGIVMAVAGGHGLYLFGLELVPELTHPNNPEEVIALSVAFAEIGERIHSLGGSVLPLAVGLHIVGALKHHLLDKDETLRRMLGISPR